MLYLGFDSFQTQFNLGEIFNESAYLNGTYVNGTYDGRFDTIDMIKLRL